ncbi:hypothetical protein [Amphritea sp. HPY]|uniref:hypothetical protein n=1 Tax=Amphritea sp. HPY TaxID=3421652 RepID=UPI003D7D095D
MKDKRTWAIPARIGAVFSTAVATTAIFASTLQAADTALCYSQFDDSLYSQAVESCRADAELGDAKAAFLLATIYYQGLEGDVDDQRGLFWDQVAAEKGHPQAAYRLALAYRLGQGVRQDSQQAFRWYMQAAQGGHSGAQRNLGAMYESGQATMKDLQRAHSWYKKAAFAGDAEAQLRLGTIWLEGRGVSADKAKAQHWIRKSAQSGNHNAQLALGVMLADVDPQDSAIWYRKSADQGNLLAMQNLALIYFTGQGVAIDLQKALLLAQQAVAQGNQQAKPLLQQIQLQLGQQKVADLRAEKAKVAALINSQQISQTNSVSTEIRAAAIASGPASPSILALPAPAAGPSITGPVIAQPLTVKTSKAAESLSGILPDGWILDQPESRYVIQLANGDEEVGIQRFIRNKNVPVGARYYRTQRDAGLFYVLIYGEYGSVKEAREALLELPTAVRKNHWIRNISTLQENYRKPKT